MCRFNVRQALNRVVWRAVVISSLILASTATAEEPKAASLEKLTLWTGSSPIGDGQLDTAVPTITVHRPAAEKVNGAAVVICPGGGYGGLVVGAEGHAIAQWLVQHGVERLVS